MSVRYAQWGKTRIHIADVDPDTGLGTTVCGREVPPGARTSIYSPIVCSRCSTKATDEQKAAAEDHRLALYNRLEQHQNDMLTANQRGEFVVYRCKTCGRQHRGPVSGPGQPYCEQPEFHVADLEELKVQGPAFEPEAADAA